MNTHANRFNSPTGLSTNIDADDAENLGRVRFVLDQWESGTFIEMSPRASNEWRRVDYLSELLEFRYNRFRRVQ